MYVALDVHYAERETVTAAVGFDSWSDATSTVELLIRSELVPAAYEPGSFYRRELPFLLQAVRRLEDVRPIAAAIVDGHVWLRNAEPGLGARLYEAVGGRWPVIGVAKAPFSGGDAFAILRSGSTQPLFVTAAGMEAGAAAVLVRGMPGPHRMPRLLKRADQLARGHALPDAAKMLQ